MTPKIGGSNKKGLTMSMQFVLIPISHNLHTIVTLQDVCHIVKQ